MASAQKQLVPAASRGVGKEEEEEEEEEELPTFRCARPPRRQKTLPTG